jgi:hypothetical protein
LSKLTEFQIYATIRGLEASIARHESEGNKIAVRRSRKKLDGYRAELDALLRQRIETGERLSPAIAEVA